MGTRTASNSNVRFVVRNYFFSFLLSISIFSVVAVLSAAPAALAQQLTISPPLVTLIPRDLGNNEIWYVGGTATVPNAEILIYLQSSSGETHSFVTRSNEKGEWFYSHTTFLKPGAYRTWAQLKVGAELSPPSPEVAFEIVPTALQIGSLRLSYEGFYLFLAVTLFSILLGAVAFLLYHFWHYHRKSSRLQREIREAEAEARSGFLLLRNDIREELKFIAGLKKSRRLSIEEHRREEKFLSDLDFVESHVLKEIQDIGPATP